MKHGEAQMTVIKNTEKEKHVIYFPHPMKVNKQKVSEHRKGKVIKEESPSSLGGKTGKGKPA